MRWKGICGSAYTIRNRVTISGNPRQTDQRTVLEYGDGRVDRGRERDPTPDRQRHVQEGREAAETQSTSGLAVAIGHRLEAGAEVLRAEGAAPDHEHQPGRRERRQP